MVVGDYASGWSAESFVIAVDQIDDFDELSRTPQLVVIDREQRQHVNDVLATNGTRYLGEIVLVGDVSPVLNDTTCCFRQ